MPLYWWRQGSRGLWAAPAALGVLLILIGLLLYVMPELLSYVVASIFIIAGCGLLASAWRMRRQVRYQRIDHEWEVHDVPDDRPRP